jgi:hypothetical protein
MSSHCLWFLRGVGVWIVVAGWGASLARAETLARAQRQSEELVREALSCEMGAMDEQRQLLLDRALKIAPEQPSAHWHNGEVRIGNQWQPVTGKLETDNQKRLREMYEERRAQAADTVVAQLALADWCAKHHLPAQETAHLHRVIQLAPDHVVARQRLQFERVGNKWVRRQDLWKGLRQPQQLADSLHKWQKKLDDLRHSLRRNAVQQTARIVQRLKDEATVDAVPAIEIRLGNDSEAAALAGVEILGVIQPHEAAGALARLAVLSPWPAVRTAAAQQLRSRPRDHYVPMLLAELSTPIASQVQTTMVNGRIVYRHQFNRETQERRESAVVDTVLDRRPGLLQTVSGGSGAGLPAADDAFELARAETRTRALAEAQATAYVREWGRLQENRRIEALNDRICETLRAATGKNLPAEAQAWWSWWDADNEVTLAGEKPYEMAYRQDVRMYTDTQPILSGAPSGSRGSGRTPSRCECFVAGTLVWTIAGPVEIEKIRVGDLVLSQEPDTGELAYQPVLQTTQRPPERLVKVHLAARYTEALEGSGGHPLWVAGEGWVNLRRVKSGMVLHGVGDSTVVSDVEETDAQTTYNLVVDQFHTYVVGEARILCHDNTARRPTNALVPGLTTR